MQRLSKIGLFSLGVFAIIAVVLPLLAELNANWVNGVVTGMALTMLALLTTALFEGDL